MVVVATLALVVAWSVWDGTARGLENRRRIGLLGQIGPEVHRPPSPPGRPSARRLRGAVVSATLWTGAFGAAVVTWGGAPISFLLGIVAVLYVGDLISVCVRRATAAPG